MRMMIPVRAVELRNFQSVRREDPWVKLKTCKATFCVNKTFFEKLLA